MQSEPCSAAAANQHLAGPNARWARIRELERTVEDVRATCAAQRERLAELEAAVQAYPGRWSRLGRDGVIEATGGSLPEACCLGVSPECQRGSKLCDMLPAEGARQFHRALRRVEESSTAAEFGYAVLAAGKRQHFWAQLAPTPAEGPTLFVYPIADPERRQVAHGDSQPPAWCARNSEHPGVCAGGIVHDVNNLLNSVLCNASLALERMPADAAGRALVERIERAASRAGELTSQVLVCSGKGRLVKKPIDVSRLVEETVQLLESTLPGEVALEQCLAKEPPSVSGDAAQLRRVVMNLITNAAEALGGGEGRVALRTGVGESPEGLSSVDGHGAQLPAGRYVYVEVADTGCGMDADTQAAMFEPFYTTKSGGHGLGLAAALAIARRHEGTIQVESVPGQGSTLRMVLPATPSSISSQT